MPPQLLLPLQINCEVCKHWAVLHAAKVNTVFPVQQVSLFLVVANAAFCA